MYFCERISICLFEACISSFRTLHTYNKYQDDLGRNFDTQLVLSTSVIITWHSVISINLDPFHAVNTHKTSHSMYMCVVRYVSCSVILCRNHSGYAFSQWERTLQRNVFFHWLSAYPEWSLLYSDTSGVHDIDICRKIQFMYLSIRYTGNDVLNGEANLWILLVEGHSVSYVINLVFIIIFK